MDRTRLTGPLAFFLSHTTPRSYDDVMGMSPYFARIRALVGAERLMIPSVAAVIHDDLGRLCVQRNAEGFSLPAGAIEPGETPLEALAREIREETGFRVKAARLLDIFGGRDFRHEYPNGDKVEYCIALYRVSVTGTSRPTDSETLAIEWHPCEALPAFAMPWPVSHLNPPGHG